MPYDRERAPTHISCNYSKPVLALRETHLPRTPLAGTLLRYTKGTLLRSAHSEEQLAEAAARFGGQSAAHTTK